MEYNISVHHGEEIVWVFPSINGSLPLTVSRDENFVTFREGEDQIIVVNRAYVKDLLKILKECVPGKED